MDDASGMGLRESVGDLAAQVQRVAEGEPPAADPVRERAALDVLHGDEVDAVRLVDVVDRDDVGIVEGGGRAGLLDEALPPAGVGHPVRGQEFQGDEAAETGVASLVDDTHPAFAELLDDLVVRHEPTDHQALHGDGVAGCCADRAGAVKRYPRSLHVAEPLVFRLSRQDLAAHGFRPPVAIDGQPAGGHRRFARRASRNAMSSASPGEER